MKDRYSLGSKILSAVFFVLCIVWIMPVFEVVINSFKGNEYVSLDPFALPNAESFVGFANYLKGMTFGNYPFLKSVGYSFIITVLSVFLILLFTSMSAWYIARVNNRFSKGRPLTKPTNMKIARPAPKPRYTMGMV